MRQLLTLAALAGLSALTAACSALPDNPAGSVERGQGQFYKYVGEPVMKATHSPLDPWPTFGALEVITIINTDKTMTDHVAGWITGKDCSSVRANSEWDGRWCIEHEPERVVLPPRATYCYRSLGRVDCYEQPALNRQLLGRDVRSPIEPPLTLR